MTADYTPVLQAPFVRRQLLGRVRAVIARYDALLDAGSPTRALRVPVLFRFPSALRERDAVGRDVLAQRREMADDEWRALKAAAPVPAPIDRPDRLLIQSLAEAQWLARELRALRRVAKRRSAAEAEELYFETRPQDPLPEPGRLLSPLGTVGRGKLVNLAFHIASVRFGVPHLAEWLVTAPASPSSEPVSAGPVASLADGQARRVMIGERPVAVFRVGERICAVGAICPHRGGALDEGEIEDGAVLCPLHAWAFDLETGQMRGRPTVCVPTYRVDVKAGEILVLPPNKIIPPNGTNGR